MLCRAYGRLGKPSCCCTLFCHLHIKSTTTATDGDDDDGQCSFATIPTFTSHLRWCSDSQALHQGMAVHHHILKQGLDSNPFLFNLILQMYGACGACDAASTLFMAASCPCDTFSYNFMISAFCLHGQHLEGLQHFHRMHLEAAFPDQVTYTTVIIAFACVTLLNAGKCLHASIVWSVHASVATALVHMYGKCGHLLDAQRAFESIVPRDVVAYNCILAVHAGFELGWEALALYEEMEHEGIIPDAVTFISLLSACDHTMGSEVGECIHMEVVSRGFEADNRLGNALVHMYARSSSLDSARLVFETMPERNAVSWNTLMGAYAKSELRNEVIPLFKRMQEEGLNPDKVTLLSVISGSPIQDALCIFDTLMERDTVFWNALIKARQVHKHHGQVYQLHQQMQAEGVLPNRVTYISVLSTCASEQSHRVGKQVHVHVVSSGLDNEISLGNALISMYQTCNDLENAKSTFHTILDGNVITWTIMMSLLTQMKKYGEAVELSRRMLLEGMLLDNFAFATALDACSSVGAFCEGKRVHTHMVSANFDVDMVLGAALVIMYGECGSYGDSKRIFTSLGKHDTVTFNAMITICAHYGRGDDALELFYEMHRRGIITDGATILSLLTACSHAGLVEAASHHFCVMMVEHGEIPMVEHYDCIVDVLGRTGRLVEAEHLISTVHTSPTAVSFRTLLGACWQQADVHCGEYAATQAFFLDPRNDGCDLLMSNLYASCDVPQDFT